MIFCLLRIGGPLSKSLPERQIPAPVHLKRLAGWRNSALGVAILSGAAMDKPPAPFEGMESKEAEQLFHPSLKNRVCKVKRRPALRGLCEFPLARRAHKAAH